jgi:hypothetical protein
MLLESWDLGQSPRLTAVQQSFSKLTYFSSCYAVYLAEFWCYVYSEYPNLCFLKVYQATDFRNTDAAREILKGIQLKPKFLTCYYDNSSSIEGNRANLGLGQKEQPLVGFA